MNPESKVSAEHLKRAAYLYIRQSTLRQVLENTESTQRQYGLRRRAISLGWSEEQIVVIDNDQAQSGASKQEREGFQRLVADVGLGKAGIVMGLEVSRLARNCADWHHLLEICALTHTLILDEDGLYDPGHFNDRLLLGLKGTMSEAELHILKARLLGGVLSKAERGELRLPLPVGLVYDQDQKVRLDPDQQVQSTLRRFFDTFDRAGSAWATVQAFGKEGLKFPKRGQAGSGEIIWQELTEAIALDTLHNPRYAGTYCFGRSHHWKDAQGKCHTKDLPLEQWRYVIKDAHPGYLTWDQFLANDARLRKNHQVVAGQRSSGTPREGPALLQGLAVCGRCGRMMSVRYHSRRGRLQPEYRCQKDCVQAAKAPCQQIPGAELDEAVGKLLVETVTPLALEVALNVQAEIQTRLEQADQLRRQHVQRAQYEADQAKLRFMRVDPNNRLVADTLERDWDEKLRHLTQAKQEYEKQSQTAAAQLTAQQKAKVIALATDFPKLWNDPKTPDRERKRMAQLLLSDVTLRREQEIIAQLRFRGGALRQLRLAPPKTAWELKKTKPEIISEIDRLSDKHTEGEIANLLNERGWRSSGGNPFTLRTVQILRHAYHLKSRRARLQAQGLLTARQIGAMIGAVPGHVKYWRETGPLKGIRVSEKNEYLYQKPTEAEVREIQGRREKHYRNALLAPSPL